MKDYIYQNTLNSKKQLKELLAWSFSKYDSMQASLLADELKYLGFKYATQAGISISIEDLKVPITKNEMLKRANQDILNAEKICLKGKITDVERFQKIIDTWSIASESLKDNLVSYFKKHDPLNSVYVMAFSGARGNLSQVRQLIGIRGLMADPSGEIMRVPIKKNFREGLTITDYLMSGYGARKGIVDTALKTANSGYLTRRLIDVAQDIIIREKNCRTTTSFLIDTKNNFDNKQIIGRTLAKSVYDPQTKEVIAIANIQITPQLLKIFNQRQIEQFHIRSPLTCRFYRSICQVCYGWDLSNQNLVDLGEAIGILAGQSIGEPGTQLTMRTFHTGGIFTSEARQQIISPMNGIVRFSNLLKTITLRTNVGEDVLLTKNAGSLILIPESDNHEIIKLELFRNTILFVKGNQYIKKSSIIGEFINTRKQKLTQKKPILSDTDGEIFIPKIKTKESLIKQNNLLWILAGHVYQAPSNSFLNFYNDYKIKKNSYIFRTKLINQNAGYSKSLKEQKIEIISNPYTLLNTYAQKAIDAEKKKTYLINCNNSKYLVTLKDPELENCKDFEKDHSFLITFTNKFKTLTGGTAYYIEKYNRKPIDKILSYIEPTEYKEEDITIVPNQDTQLLNILKISKKYLIKAVKLNPILILKLERYLKHFSSILCNNIKKGNYKSILKQWDALPVWKIGQEEIKVKLKNEIPHNSLIWLSEETYNLNCDKNILLVEDGDFISEKFEIIPNLRSKTSGIVMLDQKNSTINGISIKEGIVYQGKHFEQLDKHVYYPGEIIFNNIKIKQPSLCENLTIKTNNQLLIRPFSIYEIPREKTLEKILNTKSKLESVLNLTTKTNYFSRSNEKIKKSSSINLISQTINLASKSILQTDVEFALDNYFNLKYLNFRILKKLILNNYLSPHLKYTNLQSSLLIESGQFIDSYTTLGYFESITMNFLKIVKFKSKIANKKQIFLISNDNCVTVEKKGAEIKTVDGLITNNISVNQIGKILIDNDKFLTIQKGRPYFFPNCKSEILRKKLNLQYRIFTNTHKCETFKKNFKSKSLCYCTITEEGQVKKIFIKKNKKVYSSLIPLFAHDFSITEANQKSFPLFPIIDPKKKEHNLTCEQLEERKMVPERNKKVYTEREGADTTKYLASFLILKTSKLVPERNKQNFPAKINFTGITVWSRPDSPVHSITEDYFEQDVNNVYCRNGEFIEKGHVIGLLNFEKEVTGDIVQGLPRIEELLEARKEKVLSKYTPLNQKHNLLSQKTSLDSSFEFRKLGTNIKENGKINPHNLLKVYFEYYLSMFLNDYYASYRAFKKIQLLILNTVQSVYQSQGVSIANKHLEVIIRLMTTKVLITHEGHTALLPGEVIDLYHMQYINQIISANNKKSAHYYPFLLGITKAALNNPSFISAASFQETTRVLTKAAIEGRMDWLRGLKENIIIGHLIPSGTGYQSYKNCFNSITQNRVKVNLEKIEI